MDYEDESKDWLPIVAVVIVLVLLVGGGVWWLFRGGEVTPSEKPPVAVEESSSPGSEPELLDVPEEEQAESSQEVLDDLQVKPLVGEPIEIAGLVAEALESGDLQGVSQALKTAGVAEEDLAKLQALSDSGLRLKSVREVGELEVNKRKRFAIEWENLEEELRLEVAKGADGLWKLDSLQVEPEAEVALEGDGEEEPRRVDAMTLSDRFLQAALQQDFEEAKAFVDTQLVSDAKIAAMCILFEEGRYRINPENPLRLMFARDTRAGFLANVLTADEDKKAQFAVTLSRAVPEEDWKISEINLDALLADYATRVAGGDVHFTPLVPNPSGGETLMLYFDFDEGELAPRTERQLDIVADILKTDESRTLTISGHADALGSDEYNRKLSAQRAESVRVFLVDKGVDLAQILTLAEGESRPRVPNETESGEDNPEGRRANRRTEIYLDFK